MFVRIIDSNEESEDSSEEGEVIYPMCISMREATQKRVNKGVVIQYGDNNGDEGCNHFERDYSGVCLACGHWDEVSMESRGGKSIGSSKSILKDIKNYPISEEIKIRAENIYKEITSEGLRTNSKIRLIAYCIYQSGLQLGNLVTTSEISSMTGLTEHYVIKSIKYYSSPANTAYKGEENYLNIVELIEFHGKKQGLTEQSIQLILEEYNSLISISPEISSKPPATLVAALIYIFKRMSGIPIEPEIFLETFGLNMTTISTLGDKIFSIQNSMQRSV